MIDQTQRKAYGLIFFTFFIWGSVYVAGKIASTSMPSFLVAALRSVISMVPLWAPWSRCGHCPGNTFR